jgi:hypothetical protein
VEKSASACDNVCNGLAVVFEAMIQLHSDELDKVAPVEQQHSPRRLCTTGDSCTVAYDDHVTRRKNPKTKSRDGWHDDITSIRRSDVDLCSMPFSQYV